MKFGNVSPEYPVITLRTRPPRKNNAPRLDSDSMASVNCGSRPHHWRTTSRVAAVQRVADHGMQHVTGANVRGHGVGERASFVVHTGNVVISGVADGVSGP